MARKRYWSLATLLTLFLAAVTANAATLVVGGTGSSEPIIRLLFEEFRKQAPEARLKHLSPPLGSGGALNALAAGRIGMAVVGRPLRPEDSRRVGRHFPLADTAFVFASRDGKAGAGFTLEQIARIYDGGLRTWPDGTPIRLILRPAFESDSITLKAMSAKMDRAVTAAALRPGMVMGDNDFHTLKLIADTPGSLGTTTLGMLATTGSRVVVVPIDGVAPSLANLENGSYAWCKSLTVVLPLRPGVLAERFLAFLRSPAAAKLLLEYDYLPGVQ
ncbi:substrate-binding domain-containing protein [Accumulibacter sp.]|uniref:PstS family phosphate ABC transporter substrate-binding protein n=1 Tax=Accumulibacter sp. TaxID=2053492 RepID=UPI0025E0122A|nr:substrate-binding domain-containing protein [Accumulibacter sp.]MCP5228666.1 substrate-binding domain-containing protein [Accumulibacter sp.]